MRAPVRFGFALALAALAAIDAAAAGGPIGIDHRLNYDDRGVWQRRSQLLVEDGMLLAVVGGALWQGDQSRLGHAYWQAVDSVVIGSASAAVLKLAFSRARPAQTESPDEWFKGHGHNSFPSGEVAAVTSAITPFVLEYGAEHPAAYALELLPAYVAVGRLKVQAHWQSDTLAAYALGTAVGCYAHQRANALSVGVLPHGVTLGWHTRF